MNGWSNPNQYLDAGHPAGEVCSRVAVGDVGDQLQPELSRVKDPLQGRVLFRDIFKKLNRFYDT